MRGLTDRERAILVQARDGCCGEVCAGPAGTAAFTDQGALDVADLLLERELVVGIDCRFVEGARHAAITPLGRTAIEADEVVRGKGIAA